MTSLDFPGWSDAQLARVEQALHRWVPADAPAGLGEAMRYAVLDGGKRARPLLVLAACEAVRGNDQAALLTPGDGSVPEAMQAALCRLLARAAGSGGMAGGQAIDLASVGKPLSEPQLRGMHRLKTGALLQGSVRMGAACAPQGVGEAALAALDDYGAAVGLAFQVVDDILDVTADSAALGKTAGKDAAADKPTYVSLLGLDASRALARELLAQAQRALDASGLPDAGRLRALADLVVQRNR